MYKVARVKEVLKKARTNPEAQEILDNLIHDIKSKEATKINNEGLESQITYALTSGYGADEIERALNE